MNKKRTTPLFKNGLKLIWILFVLISIVVWLPRTDKLLRNDFSEISKHVSLDDNWNIRLNDSDYYNISLENFQFDAVNKGDTIVMQKTLPSNWNITTGALRFHIRQSAVKMYIDNELIYEYGFDRLTQNKTLGSGFQFINFPKEYEGKNLKIELYVTENQAFTQLDSIYIYEWANAYRTLLTENRIPMFLGSFLIIFGLATIMITMFALLFSRKFIRLFCISIFSICIGLWTLCYYNVILIYSIPLYSVSLIEYMSLYLSPIPLLIYMYDNIRNLKSKVLKFIYWVLLTAQVLFDMVIFSLHTMDIVHCAAVLKYIHVLIVIYMLYFSIIVVINLKYSKLINRLYLLGMLIIGICIGYDLISYQLNRFSGGSLLPLNGVSAIGVLIFIFILIITFYINLTEKIVEEKELNYLIKSAYTDELTQLYNRRYCSEYIDKINNAQTSDYAIFSFDLNNLKFVNDTYGHAKGDILIKSAADVISKTFHNHGITGRMGGDEFITILTTSDKEKIEKLVSELQHNIERKNKEIPDLNLSIAYGYALGYEISERNIEKLYQIADNRMYENKKKYKEKNSFS